MYIFLEQQTVNEDSPQKNIKLAVTCQATRKKKKTIEGKTTSKYLTFMEHNINKFFIFKNWKCLVQNA